VTHGYLTAEDGFGLLCGDGDPAADSRMIGAILSDQDAEQVFDLTGADAHGERGDRQASASGLIESGSRRGVGDLGRSRCGNRGLQAFLDPSGLVVEGLSAAAGLVSAA
jgi:hypothetical protein